TVPSGEFDFGDELRLNPMPVGLFARRALAAERTLVSLQCGEFFEKPAGIARVKAGADAARMNEVAAAINADNQRAQIGGAAPPATNDNLLAASAFRFLPAFCAPRLIRGARSFGDDAFKFEIACGLEHSITGL